MAQQATLEPGNPLYELAQTVDLNKVPDKLICKSCQNFLLNGFKTACCEGSICESCNTASTGKPCPLCKHEPFFSNGSKAVRGTARSYLKSLANVDTIKPTEAAPLATAPDSREVTTSKSRDPPATANDVGISNGESAVEVDSSQELEGQAGNVVQSIEEPKEISRRQTMDSASGNDPDLDDDIEITVGTYEPSVPKERSQIAPMDDRDQGWDAPQTHPPPPMRKGSTAQMRQEQSYDGAFGFDNNGSNMEMPPNDAMMQMQNFMQMMQQGGMNPQNMPFLNNNPNPNQLQMQIQMQSMMQGLMANMSGMQNMGMPMMNPQGWGAGMNGFQNFQGMAPSMMGNGAGFNQGPQQYQQNYGDHRPGFNQRNGSFGYSRGRGKNRGRGRGGAFQHNQQDSYAYNNNMPFPNQFGPKQNQSPNQYDQGSINFSQPQYDQNSTEAYTTNQTKDHEQPADDNDFAPGGQEEVEEALGEEYKRKTPTPVAEIKAEEPSLPDIKHEYQEEPSTEVELLPTVESPAPQHEPEEKYIPEAYREDLSESYSAAPPSAPLGPSAKIVAFRERGHGRFPSRGRGSFHGSNGYAPRSPARPVSQHQTNSPTTNAGSGVIGAPTGPRAMREKDVPSAPMKSFSRQESDVGIKIRGTANQPRRDDTTRSATPKSAYDEYGDRDRDTNSRRYSKYDKKDDGRYSYHDNGQGQGDYDEYESSRDRKRRKSRRDVEEDYYDNDHEIQDTEMSEPQDRSSSHRERSRRDRDREKEKTRDKYSSSTSKPHKSSSSRRHDDIYDDYSNDNNGGPNEYEPSDERTSRSAKKSSSSGNKHDNNDREDRERRDRDHERAEKDKHRKRSRHDREREEDYEDADEEESRRRSRKHKREHTSSRKDRDRDRDRDRERERDDSTDLGLRITGRSSKGTTTNNHSNNHVASGTATSNSMVDKDPHTLEREARNRERMLKEQQRRENAEKSKGMSGSGGIGGGGLSGGRTRSFKYEDEIERSLGRSSKRR